MRCDGMAIDHRTGGWAYNVYNETPLGARRLILETKDEWMGGTAHKTDRETSSTMSSYIESIYNKSNF